MPLIAIGPLDVVYAVSAMLAILAAFAAAYYVIRSQALRIWKDLNDGLKQRVGELEAKVAECEKEHTNCNRRVNKLTGFNLRMQARERRYQTTINALEHKLNLPVTDWLDVETPEDPDFG